MNIKQAANKTNISERNIRFYEQKKLIKIPRQENGYRYFSKENIVDLLLIYNAKIAGFSLKEMKTLLDFLHNKNRKSADIHKLVDEKIAIIDDEIKALNSSKLFLKTISQNCANNSKSECSILDNLIK